MRLLKLSIVFLVLIGVCAAEMVNKIEVRDMSAELEDIALYLRLRIQLLFKNCKNIVPQFLQDVNVNTGMAQSDVAGTAVNILTNCYTNLDKTIVLGGNFPGTFLKKLSSRQFSLVLLNDRKRLMNHMTYSENHKLNKVHNVWIFVMIGSNMDRLFDTLVSVSNIPYWNVMAYFLVIGWPPENKNSICINNLVTINMLNSFNTMGILNVNVLCHYRKGTVVYSSNPFVNQAPKPWRMISSARRNNLPHGPIFYYFGRKYRESKDMCRNLYFDKTRDLGGLPIKTITFTFDIPTKFAKSYRNAQYSRLPMIEEVKCSFYIWDFFAYVNATSVETSLSFQKNGPVRKLDRLAFILSKNVLVSKSEMNLAYPDEIECFFVLTHFRGYKSQFQKMYSMIDTDSWIGVAVVYFVTQMFLKYFLGQTMIDGIMNLLRLTCNCGFTTLPGHTAPRIYLSCLLFFVVTMQGIFSGNLATLLTHDFPVRQVNSIQDLADFGLTVYVPNVTIFSELFKDTMPKDRVKIEDNIALDCFAILLNDPLVACLEAGPLIKEMAPQYNLHSSDCVTSKYMANPIPDFWPLEERYNKFRANLIETGIVAPFYYLVDEKRLIEKKSEEFEAPLGPRIMTLNDLAFTFIILGTGLTLALITFIIEIMIHRYHRRVRTTPVVFFN